MIKSLLVRFILLFYFTANFASAAGSAVSTKATTTSKNVPTISRSSYAIGYFAKTNLVTEPEQRSYEHEMSFDYSFALSEDNSIDLGTGLSASAQGSNFKREEGNPAWKDISLGFSNKTKVFKYSALESSIENSFPTGYESQQEQYKSTLGGKSSLINPLLNDRLIFLNTLAFEYIFNTYSESVTTLESNPENTLSYKTGLTFLLTKNWAIGGSAAFETVHFINGENKFKNLSKAFLTYSFKTLTLSTAIANGDYRENESPRWLYQDDTKQIVSVGAKYEF
jgi:hypothetical protein